MAPTTDEPLRLTAAEQIAQFRARRKLKLVTRSLKKREQNMSQPVPEDAIEGRASASFLRGVFEMQRLRQYQQKLRDQLP